MAACQGPRTIEGQGIVAVAGNEGQIEKAVNGFEEGLDNDLNISPSIAAVFDFVREINSIIAEKGLSESDKNSVLDTLTKKR